MGLQTATGREDVADLRDMLLGSGYSNTAIDYFLKRPSEGALEDADHVTELTGTCGDTMKVYLKLDSARLKEVRFQVLGCPGAVASAMAAADLVRGRTVEEAMGITDRDIFRALEAIPDQKMHCIHLAVKTLQKALQEIQCL